MYSVNQSLFLFQDGCCWLASSMAMLYNNILHKPITQSDILDISDYCMNDYGVGIPWTWAPILAGTNRAKWYARDRYNKRCVTMTSKLFWKACDIHLRKWRVVAVNIQSSQEFKDMRQNSDKIQWDFTNSSKTYWHRLWLFMMDDKYYFLNSRYWDNRDIKEVDKDVIWLFKKDTFTILY